MTGPGSPVQRAALLHDSGRYTEALRLLGPHLAANPDDPRGLYVAGLSQLGAGDLDGALDTGRRLAVAAPDDVDAFLLLADTHSRRGELALAEAAAGEAIRLAPNNSNVYRTAALVDLRSHMISERTEAVARKAVALDPHSAAAHRMLGTVLIELRKRDAGAAHLQRAAALKPGDSATANELARLALIRGDSGSAALGFAAAARADPTNTAAIHNLNITAWRSLGIAQFVLWIAFIVLSRVRLLASGEPQVWLRVAAGVAVAIVLATWAYLLRRAWRGLPVLLRAFTADRMLLAGLVVHVLTLLCLVAGLSLSGANSDGALIAGVVFMLVATGLVWYRGRRLRRVAHR